MNRNTVEDEEMKLHMENKYKALCELQKLYAKHSYCRTCNLDSSTDNLVETKESASPVVEDLLKEMNEKKVDENSNANCYRCRHFLNIPQNLVGNFEEISSCTKEYEDNLTFVQAVVWLKSAIKFMKEISTEQFHLAFHKQWSNNRKIGKDPECCNQSSSFEVEECDIESLTSFNERPESFSNDSEDTISIDLLFNVNHKKSNTSQNDYEQHTIQSNEDSIRRNSCLSISGSQSPERYFNRSRRDNATLNNHVIPDSGSEYSSSSDMFKDSLASQETDNTVHNEKVNESFEESSFTVDESAEIFSFVSQCTDSSSKSFLGAQNLDDLQNDEYKRSPEPSTQASDSNYTKKIPSISTNQIDTIGSPPKDSAYDTYPLSAEHFPQNEDCFSSQKLDFITFSEKDRSASDSDSLKILSMRTTIKDWASEEDQQLYASASELLNSENDENACSIDTEYSIYQGAAASQQNECSETDENLVESIKCEISHEMDCISVENVKEDRKISSQLLSFTLDALNVDDIAFRSVKAILSIFQDKRTVKQYMRKRCWEDTLEAQAVNAILDFRDAFEAENITDVCTHEILQTVRNALDKCIGNTELNKTTIMIHQVSIILQLCSSMPICIGTIDYLTAKLKSQETVLTSVINDKKADIHNIMSQLNIIFYALSLCLQKYRLVFPNTKDYRLEEEIIPSVIDLWKKQSKVEGIMLEDSVHTREQRWSVILNDFTIIAIDDFPQFAEKSRRLSNMLTRK